MITGLHHATLLSSDLAASRAFYEGVLGLQPDIRRPAMSFDGIWYQLADGRQIHLMRLPDPDASAVRPAHGGRDRHLAMNVSNLQELAQRLELAGIDYTPSQSQRPALFCRDPDGNALEFIATSNEP